MLVQLVVVPGSGTRSWTVLGDGDVPVVPNSISVGLAVLWRMRRTERFAGSTRTLFIIDRSITSPSSQLPRPGPSAASTQRAIRRGRLLIIPLYKARTES